MQTFHRSPFLTIHTEGALLPVDLLQRILAGDKGLGGLAPEDYHLSGEKVNEAINRSWNHLQGAWEAFQTSRGRLKEGDPGTTLTRERWLLPLFQELGYGRLQTAKAIEIEGKSYAISHTWGSAELPTPIHLVGCGVDIEKRQAGVSGASKSSPHSLMQELLNRDDTRQWGLISNGLRLRVLRDNASLTRQAFLEFDLEAMFGGEIYADFAVLWLACHQSRLEGDKPEVQWLERWSQVAQEQGTRALEGLRSGVEEAILALGQGFLAHPANQALRQQLKSGKLDRQQYFRQLLRLVYRLIFLFVAEDRDLLLLPEATPEAKQRYLKFYSTVRLRRLAERQRGGRHPDLWLGLQVVMGILSGEKMEPQRREERKDRLENEENFASFASSRLALGLPVLGGFLFSHKALPDLEAAQVDNQALLNAVRSLAFTQEKNSRRAVDYKNLGSEELGSVYESLLELQPILNIEVGTFQLTTAAGNERKTSGSYYTNAGLIKITLDSALDPVIEQALQKAEEDWNRKDAKSAKDTLNQENFASFASLRLLSLKICDPASGSGHFLIAAARRVARRLAQVRSGDEEPSPSMIRHALREVIAHCIYGVDINPMAVELCKVNLWLEALEPGKPLTFLDAHIKCGNSLVGVGPGMDVYDLVIPDEAFNPVTGDDKKVAAALKRRNKQERQGQLTFDLGGVREEPVEDYAARLRQVEAMPEDDAEQVVAKAAAYEALQTDYQAQHRRLLADLWTAAFFWRLQPDPNGALVAPTQGEWRNARMGKPSVGLTAEAYRLAEENSFFHWPLEFPNVLNEGGFNCLLGNPPWERPEFHDDAYWINDVYIVDVSTVTERLRRIDEYRTGIDVVKRQRVECYERAKHSLESIVKHWKGNTRFRLTASGKFNIYALFCEHAISVVNSGGFVGFIVPTSIATANTTKLLFDHLVANNFLVSLFDFLESRDYFIGLESRDPFCLLTLMKQEEAYPDTSAATFVFKMLSIEERKNEVRQIHLKQTDFELLNPNTHNCPMFYTSTDAELAKQVYRRVPVLFNEILNQNEWTIKLLRVFNMGQPDVIKHALSLESLVSTGLSLVGNRFERGKDFWLPVIESKLISQYNHHYASYDGCSMQERKKGNPIELDSCALSSPQTVVQPRFWLPQAIYPQSMSYLCDRGWLLVYRNFARSSDERTMIAAIIPFAATDFPLRVMASVNFQKLEFCLLANTNSLVFDYFVRQKVGGSDLSSYIVEQLPVLPPRFYSDANLTYIALRVLELTYTAYDLKPFADDMGYYGEPFRWDEERRALLRAELDAYYARLYGLTRDELRYILDPQDVYGPDFPGETFRVLKEKEIKQYGEYRTRRLVLEAWDRLTVEGLPVAGSKGEGSQVAGVQEDRETFEVSSFYLETPAMSVPAVEAEMPAQATTIQTSFSDFGLYKCAGCGKMVMGFDREDHAGETHKGENVEWKKVK